MVKSCTSKQEPKEKAESSREQILLMGNPNSGKSVLFSRLTGVRVMASNYPGTTVEYTKGKMLLGEKPVNLIDVPGTYSLEPTSPAEEVASKMLNQGDKIICVLDSTNLERHLYLALSVIEKGVPVVVALNMWDEASNKGIVIDVEKLESLLGVPVVPISALHGEGISNLLKRLEDDACGCESCASDADEKWTHIGRIVKEVQQVKHRHPTIGDRLSEATVRPTTGIPIALLVVFSMFYAIITIGELIIEYITEPFFYNHYGPWIVEIVEERTTPGLLREILIGHEVLIDGKHVWDYAQSFGILTTGLFVYIAMIVPFVIIFYLVLSLLEDVGYLPRMAVLMDTLFHRMGLHGSSLIPSLLGIGCNVPGILATRILETKKQRFMVSVLIAIAIPCAAMSAMVFIVLGPHGAAYVALVFISLAIIYVLVALAMNRYVKGAEYELILEMPPYRMPAMGPLLKKTGWRISSFLKDAVPYMMLGTTLAIVLYNAGVMDTLGKFTAPLVSGVLGLPEEAVIALLLGMLRKDVAVGVLLPLGLSAPQLVVAMVVLGTFFPCIAVFVMLLKEFGVRGLAKAMGIMLLVSLSAGTVMRLILLGV